MNIFVNQTTYGAHSPKGCFGFAQSLFKSNINSQR